MKRMIQGILWAAALGLAPLSGISQTQPGRVLALTSTNISARDITGAITFWNWNYPFAAPGNDTAQATVFPDGGGGYNVLVSLLAGPYSTNYCLRGGDGSLRWQMAGAFDDSQRDTVITHDMYTDPDLFPMGPPRMSGSKAPSILLSLRNSAYGGPNSSILCVDGNTGQIIWTHSMSGDHWATGFMPDINGDGYYEVVIRSDPTSSTGLWCISGKDGSTVLWTRPDLIRGGLPIKAVCGSGRYDYAIGQCCYDDSSYVVNGMSGSTCWQSHFSSFDLMGIRINPGTSDFFIGAQNSSGGGICKYQGSTGARIWCCSSTYNNQTIAGLIPGPSSSYYILSGWRHQNLAVCFNASTGVKLWDNIPASSGDDLGIAVPDQDGDGYGDVMIINNGIVSLYSTASGAKIHDLALGGVQSLAWLPLGSPELALLKAVRPSFSNLLLTTNYQLQVSTDLQNWTSQGAPFTATNNSMVYPQYWDVANWGSLFFRLQRLP